MDDLFSTVSKNIKQRAVIEFLMHESETPVSIHRQLLAIYGDDTVNIRAVCPGVKISRDGGGNLYLNDQLWSGRPVTTTHDLKRQKSDKLIPENL
jgi:hypothetical protein